MGRIRNTLVTAAIGAAIAAQGASAQTSEQTTTPPVTTIVPPAGETIAPPGSSTPGTSPIVKPPKPKPVPIKPPAPSKPGSDENNHHQGANKPSPDADDSEDSGGLSTEGAIPPAAAPLSCGSTAVPAMLIPIYQRASNEYGLGPTGPAILAAINEVETNFGQNQGPSYAGAIGWMQFMPATWADYGVDADGDGIKDPSNPEDAIFAAARYLSAGGMPTDVYSAIYAYNHADWYVQDVLARAACFQGIGSQSFMGGLSLSPELPKLSCIPAQAARRVIPPEYVRAAELAAARYGLGESGVWALIATAQIESDFGEGMTRKQLHEVGPFALDTSEWRSFAVDGDGDGRITHSSPADSAATLARAAWSRNSDIRAGLIAHNQASWYVTEVLDQAKQIAGECKTGTASYAVALPGPTSVAINWQNVTLSNELELWDIRSGAIDPRVLSLIAAISQEHQVTISSLRSDHPMNTASGNISNHYYGRALDIAAIDGVSCTNVAVESPCGVMVRTLAALPPGEMPTELIFCFDADGPGPAFAQADHCDHIHAGFDG